MNKPKCTCGAELKTDPSRLFQIVKCVDNCGQFMSVLQTSFQLPHVIIGESSNEPKKENQKYVELDTVSERSKQVKISAENIRQIHNMSELTAIALIIATRVGHGYSCMHDTFGVGDCADHIENCAIKYYKEALAL